MKTLKLALGALAFFFSVQLFAVAVDDHVSYKYNSKRSSWLIISDAEGEITVMEHRTSGDLGPGYVVKIMYRIDIRIKGRQTGELLMFIPESMFKDNFYTELKRVNQMSYGSFDMKYEKDVNVKDANGREYSQCMLASSSNINHKFVAAGGEKGKAVVLDFKYSGPISYATNLVIKLSMNPDIKVLGGVQIDVSGVSDSNIPFSIGLDAKP